MSTFKFGLIAVVTVVIVGLLLAGCAPTTTGSNEVEFPSPTDYVVDTSNVLGESVKNSIHQKLAAFDKTAQIAVVTVPSTQPLDERQYAINLAEKWKVGHAGVDNGVIFLIVTSDRKLRIEVGRGLEGAITDGEAGRILDTAVVPELKNNNWEKGIENGVDALIKEISR